MIEYENLVLHHDKSLPKSKIFQDVEPGLIDPPIGDDHMPFFQRGGGILYYPGQGGRRQRNIGVAITKGEHRHIRTSVRTGNYQVK